MAERRFRFGRSCSRARRTRSFVGATSDPPGSTPPAQVSRTGNDFGNCSGSVRSPKKIGPRLMNPAEDDAGVNAAETERIAQDMIELRGPALVRHDVQITGRIRVHTIKGGREPAFLDG